MAAVAEAAGLTETHRLAQARIGALTADNLIRAFTLLEPSDIAGTTPRWLRAASAIVNVRRRMSAALAARYLEAFRTLEADDLAAFAPILVETVTAAQLATSLTVTGPVTLQRALGRGQTLREALDLAASRSARAGMRHAMNGGRETTIATVTADPDALGWARVTSGKPCAFCAMVASRGPVYKTARNAGQGHRYHDSCSCSIEPVYRRDADWPPGTRDLADLWKRAKTSKTEDISDFTQFRRLIEGRA